MNNNATRKRVFHFYTPGVIRRSYAAAQQVRALTIGAAAAAAAAAADAVYTALGNLLTKN